MIDRRDFLLIKILSFRVGTQNTNRGTLGVPRPRHGPRDQWVDVSGYTSTDAP